MYLTWRQRLEQSPSLGDFHNWPAIDPLVVDPKHRKGFMRNREMVARALAGDTLVRIAMDYGIDSSRLTQLLNRCLGGDETVPPPLQGGLLPGKRLRTSIRRAPLGRVGQRRGARCAFGHLLAVVPGLDAYLDQQLKGDEGDRAYGQNTTPQVYHKAFIRYLKSQNWPSDCYPFTEAAEGYETLRRDLHRRRLLHTKPRISKRVILPAVAPVMVGRHLQADEHSVHAHEHVVLQLNDAWEPLRLSRISLMVACDVASDAYLGYTLALTGAPTQDDVLALFEQLRQPWQPLTLSTPGLGYPPGAQFPNGLLPEVCDFPMGVVHLDNALVHTSQVLREAICHRGGSCLNWGLIKQPKARHVIEFAFARLGIDIRRLKSTTGSHMQDPDRESAKLWKDVPVISLRALEEVISVHMATHNCTPQGALGGQTPLQIFQYQMAHFPLPLRVDEGNQQESLFVHYRWVTVHRAKSERRHHYIHLEKVRYSGLGLQRSEFIGKKIQVRFDRRDIRVLQAYSPSGEYLGELLAPKSWRRFPHGVTTRKRINKLVRQHKLQSPDWLGGYFDYLLQNRTLPKTALEIVRVYREFGQQIEFTPPAPDPNFTNTDPPIERADRATASEILPWHPAMALNRTLPRNSNRK